MVMYGTAVRIGSFRPTILSIAVFFQCEPDPMRTSLPFAALLLATCSHAQVVINEVDYDQIGTDNAEYLEIKNVGADVFPLQYLRVILINGNNGGAAEYRTIESASWPALDPGDYFVICANQSLTLNCDHAATPTTNLIQNGPTDAIVLASSTSETIYDVLSYGGSVPDHTEGTGTTAEDTNLSDGVSIGRSPDGTDTNNNDADFFLMCSTPGADNVIDPEACDLSTGVRGPISESRLLTILPAPGGDQLIVYARESMPTVMRLEVFAANGALLTSQNMASATSAQWIIDVQDRKGSMLLVRYSTSIGEVTRRVVVR